MATMLLPVTNVELPSDEWKIQGYKENKDFSEETICYKATLTHLPTKVKFYISNEGHGGSDMMDWDHRLPKAKEAYDAWKKFVKDCAPVLQASVNDSTEEWMRGLYDDADNIDHDSVIGLFVEEAANQQMLSRKRGTVVRTEPTSGAFKIYKHTPEVLMGRVQGEYWDKATKNWVSL
ncbi:MAG: hypothetical protein H9W81_07860 [Enterococcus sp.]|nr:hypothetical protein [Enterococcus sp.]